MNEYEDLTVALAPNFRLVAAIRTAFVLNNFVDIIDNSLKRKNRLHLNYV